MEQDSVVRFLLYLDSVFKNKHKLAYNQSAVCNAYFLECLPKNNDNFRTPFAKCKNKLLLLSDKLD